MRIRAAVLHAFGKPHRLEEVELRAPGPGEVLVRVTAAGVCHSDVGQADGDWSLPLPAVLGHEGSGVVESAGPAVSTVATGDRVVFTLAPGCGRCRHCVAARPILCQDALDAMASGRLTTGASPLTVDSLPVTAYSLIACFAECAVVAERSVIPIPADLPADVAALIGCAVITGVGAALESADIHAGSRGAVIGVGGVGVNAVQGARLRGAAEIVAFDTSPSRLATSRHFGATGEIDVHDVLVTDRLRRIAAREGFDWAIVTVGSVDAMRLGVDITRPGATTTIVGLAPENEPAAVDFLDMVVYEKTIRGSAYGSISPRILIPRIIDLYRNGSLLLDDLISSRLPLERIDEAFQRTRNAEGLRTVLTIPG